MGAIEVRKHEGGCGAEVLGLDLRALDDAQMAAVRRAYADNGVIFFRDQSLTEDDHIAFAKRWGEIDINKFFPHIEGFSEIAEVKKEREQKTNYRRRLAHRPFLRPDPGDGLDPGGARAAARRRRHAVRRHVCGI